MTDKVSNEDLELKTIFDFLGTVPAELLKSSTPFWQRKSWSRKTEITGEEHNQLTVYSEQLAQKVSSTMLLFAYNYFNFKKQTLSIEDERSISRSSQNILLLVLGISLFLAADNSSTLSTKIVIFLLITVPVIALYGMFSIWRNVQELQFYERVERLLEIAQKKVAEQNLWNS